MLRKLYPYLLLSLFVCTACGTSGKIRVKKYFDSDFFRTQFTGFALYDPEEEALLYSYQSDKYFTPASNTKIFTLYTGLHVLGDSIPALHYAAERDTLYIEGTGNPVFLHPYFKDRNALGFLKNQQLPIAWYSDNFTEERSGPGWAWDDYAYYYAAERSALPMYGNVLTITGNREKTECSPGYFRDVVNHDSKAPYPRDLRHNTFYVPEYIKTGDTLEIPFIQTTELTTRLLSDTLGKKVFHTTRKLPLNKKTLYSHTPVDSLFRRMMLESDNFLAEQILLMAAGTLSDSLNTRKIIDYTLQRFLPDIPQKPRWVDGSGLSRYNLFTPESMVYVLNRMYHEYPQERLFQLFPAGGVSGTLKHYYKGDGDVPYIYAKSGSLSNNYNLSGYIRTKSGKILIFSYMNNHYMHETTAVKQHMDTLLRYIREHY